MARTLHGLPDTAQFWIVDNYRVYAVFTVPNTDPPIHLAWHVPNDEDFQSFFGPGQPLQYDRRITAQEWTQAGVLAFGTTDDIPDIGEDPFSTWTRNMEVQAQSQPWILDADYSTLIAAATIEGRPLTDAEIQSTTWWRTHSKEEREWMKLYHGDPETAQTRLDDNRIRTLATLKEAGLDIVPEALVNFMADKVTQGGWTVAKFQQQVAAVTDAYSGVPIDAELAAIVGSQQLGGTQEAELDVLKMAREWLGPVHGQWDEETVQQWAGRIRNDPDAEDNLVRFLQTQRVKLFPMYEDPTTTYDQIAAPWRNFVTSVWGQTADETDPIFSTLIKNNDLDLNGQLLRQKGYERGIGKVIQDAQSDLLGVGGGAVRRALA